MTGVSPGTATITAACGSVTASTTVTVAMTDFSTGNKHRQHSIQQQRSGRHGEHFLRCAQARCHHHHGQALPPALPSVSFTYKSGNSSIATVSPSGVITP